MKYYDFDFDPEDEDAWHLKTPWGAYDAEFERNWSVTRCERIGNVPPFPIETDPGLERDFNPTAFIFPIVSSRLKQIIESICQDQVEFIPTEIDSPNEWFVVNILDSVECLDFENSILMFTPEYSENPGKVNAAIKLRLLPDRATGHHIFRIAEWRIPLIISEELASAMAAGKMTGYILQEV